MKTASLILVGTPIGNLGDLSERAKQALAEVDLIACEDTRRTGRLLSLSGLKNPGMIVMNDHTERRAAAKIVAALEEGRSVAIVSDAGMPAISDPGSYAVSCAVEAGFEAKVVPGPSAISSAVALSGFRAERFVFEGFLPRKGRDRQRRLQMLASERAMILICEAPHRVTRTLADLAETLGLKRRCVVASEMTKMHEDVWRGSLGQAAQGVGEPKGEYMIVIGPDCAPISVADSDIEAVLVERLSKGLGTKAAATEVAAEFGVARRRVYDLALGMNQR